MKCPHCDKNVSLMQLKPSRTLSKVPWYRLSKTGLCCPHCYQAVTITKSGQWYPLLGLFAFISPAIWSMISPENPAPDSLYLLGFITYIICLWTWHKSKRLEKWPSLWSQGHWHATMPKSITIKGQYSERTYTDKSGRHPSIWLFSSATRGHQLHGLWFP